MTQAGWYPDPAGQPQTYRYWDGTSWSQETTGDPYAPPPAPPAPSGPPPPPPTPPGGYGQQPPFGGGFPPAPPSGGSRGPGLTILLVVVAVLVLAGLSVGGFLGFRALAGDDDSDTDAVERSSATDTASTAPTTGSTDPTTTDPTTPTDTTTTEDVEVTDQQCRGGVPTPSTTPGDDATQVSSGALTIPVPRGYTADTSYAVAFEFADSFIPLQKVIEQGEDAGWVSIYGVGGLNKANGFEDPAQAAEVVMTCMSRSPDLYDHFSGRTDLSSGDITVDGAAAYQITSELRVDDPDLTVEGDVAQVVVVDTGDPERFGLYITVVPIGDQKLIRQQEGLVEQITVD